MSKIDLHPPTEEERARWPASVIVPLETPFADARGAIQPLVDLPMKSCVLISSKKGTVRANHYHKTDWHFCYVMKGTIEYHHRPHGSTDPAVDMGSHAVSERYISEEVRWAYVDPTNGIALVTNGDGEVLNGAAIYMARLAHAGRRARTT